MCLPFKHKWKFKRVIQFLALDDKFHAVYLYECTKCGKFKHRVL